jgi:hypothetical protein
MRYLRSFHKASRVGSEKLTILRPRNPDGRPYKASEPLSRCPGLVSRCAVIRNLGRCLRRNGNSRASGVVRGLWTMPSGVIRRSTWFEW